MRRLPSRAIAAAYTILSDPEKRAEYDSSWRYRNGERKGASSTAQRSSPSSRSTSSSSSRADRSRDGAGGGRGFDDAAERVRQWREANPTPEELGDSFGSIFRDLASAVAGGGDWLSLLELESSTDLETLLRSSDTSLLEEELESAGWVVSCLRRRIDALRDEAGALSGTPPSSRAGCRGAVRWPRTTAVRLHAMPRAVGRRCATPSRCSSALCAASGA